VDAITAVAQELGVTFWEILKTKHQLTPSWTGCEVDHKVCADDLPLAGAAQHSPASEIVKGVMADSGYIQDLQNKALTSPESTIQELYNAVQQFEEDNKTQP